MTTPTATPRKRRRLALVGALVGAVVSIGAISGTASAGNDKRSSTTTTSTTTAIIAEIIEMAAKSGIRW